MNESINCAACKEEIKLNEPSVHIPPTWTARPLDYHLNCYLKLVNQND